MSIYGRLPRANCHIPKVQTTYLHDASLLLPRPEPHTLLYIKILCATCRIMLLLLAIFPPQPRATPTNPQGRYQYLSPFRSSGQHENKRKLKIMTLLNANAGTKFGQIVAFDSRLLLLLLLRMHFLFPCFELKTSDKYLRNFWTNEQYPARLVHKTGQKVNPRGLFHEGSTWLARFGGTTGHVFNGGHEGSLSRVNDLLCLPPDSNPDSPRGQLVVTEEAVCFCSVVAATSFDKRFGELSHQHGKVFCVVFWKSLERKSRVVLHYISRRCSPLLFVARTGRCFGPV